MNLPKLNRFLFLALFSILAISVWAQTGNRYALVIGNNNYKNGITVLSTPVNDANDVSATLRTLGYETVLKTNTTITDLDEAVNQFLIKLGANKESEGFFWFAGHGVNIENKHYLLAIDVVDPRSDDSIIRGSYSVDKLLEKFDRINNKANLLVIDACRNDFVPGSRNVSGRGLAVVASDSVVGNVITYSTRAGQTADDGKPGDRNSPFCAAFLSNITTAKSFDNLFIQILNDTRTRTNGKQLPYKVGFFAIEDYAIAPINKAAQTAQTTPPRGLQVVPRKQTDMFIFFSTPSGGNAFDGTGRNSPFAEAFLKNIHKNDPLNLLAIDIIADTYILTSQTQKPVYDSRIIENRTYSIADKNFTKRYALLVGNSNYTHVPKLKNTVSDVQDVARALTLLDYEVDLRIDVSLADMEKAADSFISKLASEKESEGFFWFAGNGFQLDSRNYFLMVDTDINTSSTTQLRVRSFSLDEFLEQLQTAGNKINVLFLDADRKILSTNNR
jgi:uncharacterized caspase-like protein